MNKRSVGGYYENIAAEYLKKEGYSIVCMNYRCKIGEIDIVAIDNGCLVFCEVKYRSSEKFGSPFEAVNIQKQMKISKTAMHYCMCHNLGENGKYRFDVIGVYGTGKIEHIENAFEVFC